MDIEICTNVEFIRTMILNEDLLDESLADVAASDWSDRAFEAIMRLGGDFEPVRPGGQRQMFHGWNGAQGWSARGQGWGTFDACDKMTEEQIDAALQAVTDEIHAGYALND